MYGANGRARQTKERKTFFQNIRAKKKREKNQVRKAKKDYFQKLIERDRKKKYFDVWRALNTFTKGSQSHSAAIPKNLTADKFNNHFLSVEKFWQNHDRMMSMTLNPRIFYINFVSEKHEGTSHLSSHIFPFQNSVNIYPNWIQKVVWTRWY